MSAPAFRPRPLEGWGRTPRRACPAAAPRDDAELAALLASGGKVIARGGGRAYGDAALGAAEGAVIDMRRFDRLLALDGEGLLVAEAGVVLGDLVRAVLPRGWFPWVTPGTQYATLGGLIAADVHGKNHHRAGSFGAHVAWIDLMGPDGTVTRAEPGSELFAATLGGMGLTGVILRAAIRLQPVETGWIREETVAAEGLEAGMAAFDAAEAGEDAPPYSVAWIDALTGAAGRTLLHLGRHARAGELPEPARARPFETPARPRLPVPLDAPSWTLSPPLMRAFNHAHWRSGLRKAAAGPKLVGWEGFFYPLDALLGWNRLYGRRGFVQMQCVLPPETARAALAEMLGESRAAGLGYLGVLKRFGAEGAPFSFPRPGWTLALDIPASRRGHALADRLETLAAAAGGRFYLAKDARLPRARFDASDPRAEGFRAFRAGQGLAARFASAQSERLGL